MSESIDYDVIICGYGPTGAILANHLGRDGHRVLVLERSDTIYHLPRAAMIDAEAMRMLQSLGLADACFEHLARNPGAEFVTPDGTRLLGSSAEELDTMFGDLGWPGSNLMYQPDQEAIWREGVARFANVDVRLGHEISAMADHGSHAEVQFTEIANGASGSASARYVVGADGARSLARKTIGASWDSLGYDRDWLVVDVELTKPVDLPKAVQQICNPERPTTYVSMCKDYRRWEFQLQEGETREEMEDRGRVAELLAPWLAAGEYEILRGVVYQFHAAVADGWRKGRIILAGDAAHQMPPFLGQGMCSGFRDATNLAWRFDLLLSGRADDSLLDAYETERKPHVAQLVGWAVSVGRLIDAFAGIEAEKDTETDSHRGAGYGGVHDLPVLGEGTILRSETSAYPVGFQLPQPRIRRRDGSEVLLDDELGLGFAWIARESITHALPAELRTSLEKLGTRFVDPDSFEQLTPALGEYLERHDAILVRPDRYVFGASDATTSPRDIARALTQLAA